MSLAKYGKMAIKKYPAARKRYRVYAPAVKQLASDVMYLKGLINSEPKFHVTQSGNNVDWNGAVVSLCDIPTGDTSTNRDGDRILPRYFSINMHCGRASGATSAHLTARVIIFRSWIENPSTIAPVVTPSEVLTGASLGTLYAPITHLNANMTGSRGDRNRRIEVLRNELIQFTANDNPSQTLHYNIEMNGKNKQKKEHIEYNTAGTIQPTSGGLFILFVTDNVTSGEFYYQLESKLTFYDN